MHTNQVFSISIDAEGAQFLKEAKEGRRSRPPLQPQHQGGLALLMALHGEVPEPGVGVVSLIHCDVAGVAAYPVDHVFGVHWGVVPRAGGSAVLDVGGEEEGFPGVGALRGRWGNGKSLVDFVLPSIQETFGDFFGFAVDAEKTRGLKSYQRELIDIKNYLGSRDTAALQISLPKAESISSPSSRSTG